MPSRASRDGKLAARGGMIRLLLMGCNASVDVCLVFVVLRAQLMRLAKLLRYCVVCMCE